MGEQRVAGADHLASVYAATATPARPPSRSGMASGPSKGPGPAPGLPLMLSSARSPSRFTSPKWGLRGQDGWSRGGAEGGGPCLVSSGGNFKHAHLQDTC